jgi:hypothetical protein
MEVRCALADRSSHAVRVRAHPDVVDQIEAEGSRFVGALGAVGGLQVKLDADPALPVEQYDIEVS